MSQNPTTKYNAPALDKGLDILEYLSQEGIPLSQAEIAQGINRTQSEIYRMLVCLEERGYLRRGTNAGKYRLSLKMYSLSHLHTPFDELKRAAYYPMQALSETTRESCHLSIIDSNQLLVISQMRSPSAVSLSIEEGTHFPLSMTTSGKVLLSRFPQTKRDEILAKDEFFIKWSAAERNNLLDNIKHMGEIGFGFSDSKLTSGITDIAIPIGELNSELSAVLAVSVFTSNLKEKDNFQNILDALKRAQLEINKSICC